MDLYWLAQENTFDIEEHLTFKNIFVFDFQYEYKFK